MNNTKAIVMGYIGVLAFASLLYIAGGTLSYWQANVYLLLALVGTTLNHLLLPKGSTLEAERASRAQEGASWDKALLKQYFLLTIAMFVVAGLDSGRFGWSGSFPSSLTTIGVIIMMAGQLIFAYAKRENKFFSSTVRIQTEHKHLVCDTGLYSLVRHPGYLGMAMTLVAFPLVLNSYWAFIPAFLSLVVLMVRTAKEDAYLHENLEGYRQYADKVKWRLLPKVF